MQIMLVFEIQIFVHQIQPVDFWFNISYSVELQRPNANWFFKEMINFLLLSF